MAIRNIVLTVGLKVTDNEARSALEALQEKMGLRDRVRDLVREELWEIGVEADTEDAAVEIVAELVRTTNLFANPNKHTFTLRAGPNGKRAGAGRGAAGRSGAVELSPDEFAVLVSNREGTDGESVLSALRRIGIDSVRSVRRWTRWRVALTEPPAKGDPGLEALIRTVGVTTGRRDGLLSNPHSQTSIAVLPWGEEKRLAA